MLKFTQRCPKVASSREIKSAWASDQHVAVLASVYVGSSRVKKSSRLS